MKKKKLKRKLILSKATVADLTNKQLNGIKAGCFRTAGNVCTPTQHTSRLFEMIFNVCILIP
jgi:hypothetical protein